MPDETAVVTDTTPVDYGTLDEQGGYSLGSACVDPPGVERFLAATNNGTTSQESNGSSKAAVPVVRTFTFKLRPFFGWSATSERLRSFFTEQEFELLAGVDEQTIIAKHRSFSFRVREDKAPAAVEAAARCGFVTLRGSPASKPWGPASHKRHRQLNPPKRLKNALKAALTSSRALKRAIEEQRAEAREVSARRKTLESTRPWRS